VAQEALTNIAKHSNADHVWIRLGKTGKQVTLAISDNGNGLEIKNIGGRGPGLGLGNMRERVESLGGRFVLSTAKQGGLQILAQLMANKTTQSIHSA